MKNKNITKNNEILAIKLFILIISLIIYIFNVLAADPGHGAERIAAGTFEGGDYYFPAGIYTNLTSCSVSTSAGGLLICGTGSGDGTNISLNYVYNGSDWVGARSTAGGILQLSVSSESADYASGSFTIANNLIVDTNTLYVDATTNRVGIGTISPSTTLDVNGTINVNNNKITNVATPTASSDVATKGYADALGANYVTVSKSQKFTVNGTFTVPNNVTLVWVTAVGGGGGGGGGGSNIAPSGGGGGAGELKYHVPVTVIPSQIINITIGIGGAGAIAASNANGSNGGNTMFRNDTKIYVIAFGGKGGGGSTSGTSRGGAGGGAGGVSTPINTSGTVGTISPFSIVGGGGGGGGTTNTCPNGLTGGITPCFFNCTAGTSGSAVGGYCGGGGGAAGNGIDTESIGGNGGSGSDTTWGGNGTNGFEGGAGGGGGGSSINSAAGGGGGRGGNGTFMIEWIAT